MIDRESGDEARGTSSLSGGEAFLVLDLVEGAGHAFSQPGILHNLIEATDRFAGGAR